MKRLILFLSLLLFPSSAMAITQTPAAMVSTVCTGWNKNLNCTMTNQQLVDNAVDQLSTGGGGTPGGSNTQIQYNNNGVFAGGNMYYVNGNLGIGSSNPGNTLDVKGSINSNGLNVGGSSVQLNSNSSYAISPNGEVIVIHANGTYTLYPAASNTDASRGTALVNATTTILNKDIVYLSVGTFDIGNNSIDLSAGETISSDMHGLGEYSTIIKSSVGGPVVTIGGSQVTDLSIVGYASGSTFQFPIGLNDAIPDFSLAFIKNVFTYANTDGLYFQPFDNPDNIGVPASVTVTVNTGTGNYVYDDIGNPNPRSYFYQVYGVKVISATTYYSPIYTQSNTVAPKTNSPYPHFYNTISWPAATGATSYLILISNDTLGNGPSGQGYYYTTTGTSFNDGDGTENSFVNASINPVPNSFPVPFTVNVINSKFASAWDSSLLNFTSPSQILNVYNSTFYSNATVSVNSGSTAQDVHSFGSGILNFWNSTFTALNGLSNTNGIHNGQSGSGSSVINVYGGNVTTSSGSGSVLDLWNEGLTLNVDPNFSYDNTKTSGTISSISTIPEIVPSLPAEPYGNPFASLISNNNSVLNGSTYFNSGQSIISSNGNVGINSLFPRQALDVNGTVRMVGFQLGTSTTNGYVLTADTSGNGTWQPLTGGSGSNYWSLNGGAGNVGISTTNTVGIGTTRGNGSLLIFGGNVGIGTQNPQAKLAIGSTGQTQIDGSGNITATGGVITGKMSYTNGQVLTDGSENLKMSTSSGDFYDSTGSTGSNGQFLISQGGSLAGVKWTTKTIPSVGGSNQQIQYNNSGSFGGATNFIYTGTNIGIGSAVPGQILDVQGTVRALNYSGAGTGLTGTAASLTSGTVSTISGLVTQGTNVTITGSGTSGSPYTINSNGGTSSNYWNLSAGNVGINTTTNNVGIGTNLTTTSKLTVMGGNVGIGTWVPAGLFQIGNGSSPPFKVLSSGVVNAGPIIILNDGSGNITANEFQPINYSGGGGTGAKLDPYGNINLASGFGSGNLWCVDQYPTLTSCFIEVNPDASGPNGSDLLVVGASNQSVYTKNNTLDDGSGNANVAGTFIVNNNNIAGSFQFQVEDASANLAFEVNNDFIGSLNNILDDGTGSATIAGVLTTATINNNGNLFQYGNILQLGTNTSIIGFSNSGSAGKMNFDTSNNLKINNGFLINSIGNVGIGSATPRSLLDILGGNEIIFNGNIGIGTSTPGQFLDVQGTVRAVNFSGPGTGLTGTAASLTAGTVSTINGFITQGTNVTITGSGTSGSPYNIASSGGAAGFWNTTNTNDVYEQNGSTWGNVGIGTSITSNGALMVMNGNVGIGTWKPSAGLDIRGTLALNMGTTSKMLENGTTFLTFNGNATNSIYIGQNSGTAGDGGGQNVALGGSTLTALTGAGNNNTIVGYQAGQNITSGASDTAIGLHALENVTTGSNTIAVGVNAGLSSGGGNLTGPVTSVFLGNSTSALGTGDSNEDVIGYNVQGLGTNSVILGNSSITVTELQGNVGIGSATPGQKLDVQGVIRALSGGTCTTLYKCVGGVDAGVIQTSVCNLCPAGTCTQMNGCF